MNISPVGVGTTSATAQVAGPRATACEPSDETQVRRHTPPPAQTETAPDPAAAGTATAKSRFDAIAAQAIGNAPLDGDGDHDGH